MAIRGSNNQAEIRFSEIRALDGKQSRGFEELCVQLLPWLMTEQISRVISVNGRGGDGGIEAIAHTTNGLFAGLQAKYFSGLADAQWRQIDESVRTAIEKHPELNRYLVCVPLERTPAQITKWNSLIVKWRKLNPVLVVEWIGESALLGHLLKPDVCHLKTYWFAYPDFSMAWARTQTEVAIRQLHDRYTPALHQPTNSEQHLAFLLSTTKAKVAHQKQCSELVIAWRLVLKKLQNELRDRVCSLDLHNFEASFDAVLVSIREGLLIAQGDDLIAALEDLRNKFDLLLNAIAARKDESDKSYSATYLQFRTETKVQEALDQTGHMIQRVSQYVQAQRQLLFVLTGEAGTGKSHLLAELATNELAEDRVCLLMLGERFAANTVLIEQIPRLLNWAWSLRDLLACLSAHASITGQNSLLIVDAINEPRGSGLWRRELLSLTSLIAEYSGVRLLVSCRGDCLQSTLPPVLQTRENTIEHRGFDLKFHETVQAYFDGYNVSSPQFPTLSPEFQNPLFLKTLCEAYQGQALPLGAITFIKVLAEWENRIAANIEEKVSCPRRATKRAIDALVKALAESETKRIPADAADDICLQYFSEQHALQSLYWNLNSEGLLQEVEAEGQTWVRLQYERFSDVRIAQIVLKKFSSKQQWLKYWQSEFLPARMVAGSLNWSIGPELASYALLLPEIVGIELVECPIGHSFDKDWSRANAKETLWSAWLDALPWRALSSADPKILKLFATWANQVEDDRQVWGNLFQFACIPNHPLNADYLHKLLSRWDLPHREQHWTIPLAHEEPTDQTIDSVVGPFLYWADAAAGKASDEQVRLAAQVLLWLTTSPNRTLRDLATDAAIRSLAACQQAGPVCLYLLKQFWDVNDPYVKERLLAVMCGVLPRLTAANAKEIAEFLFNNFWQTEDVPPHILQREYAAFVIRHACETGLINNNHGPLLKHWPQKNKLLLWTEAQVDVYDKDPAYSTIAYSLRPEEMGLYGDFGRYTMGSAVHHFADNERAAATTAGLSRGGQEHDARFARRYIWQRVIELGWTPERFASFERYLGYSGRTSYKGRVERISKKYQWIGLHEYLGHSADALLYMQWDSPSRPLRGAWELHARDYHPELAFRSQSANGEGASEFISINNPLPILNLEEKRLWVQDAFQSFEPYLHVEHEQRRWVVLKAHLNFDEDMSFGIVRDGTAKMAQWIDVRVFLVPMANLSKHLSLLKKQNFFGDGCDVPHCNQCWVSEYPWHPLFEEVDRDCLENYTWLRRSKAGQGLYLPVCEISDDDRHVLLPAPSFHRDLGEVLGQPLSSPTLTEHGVMEIKGASGFSIFKSSTRDDSMLIVDETVLLRYLKARDLRLVWAVLSEKSAWNGHSHVGGLSNQSAVYVLEENGEISGGHTFGEAIPPDA